MTDSSQKGRTAQIQVLVLLTVLITIALGFRFSYNRVTKTTIQADARQYVFYAYNLYKYGIYSKEERTDHPTPDSYRSPGYPLFLSMAMQTSGPSGFIETARLWQALLSTLMVPLIYLVGIRLGSDNRVALAGASLTAVSPHLVTSSSYILTETLFGFLVLAAFALILEALRTGNVLLGVGAGFFSGGAYLTNEVFLFLPALLLVYVIFIEKQPHGSSVQYVPEGAPKRKLYTIAAVILLVFSIFPTSWSIRNKVQVVSGSLSGGKRAVSALAHGSYPGFVYKDPKFKYYPYREDPQIEEYTSSFASFKKIFVQRASEKPLDYFTWYVFGKPYYLWSWSILQGMGDVYIYPVRQSLFTVNRIADGLRVAMKFAHPFLMASCLAGLLLFMIQHVSGRDLFNDARAGRLFLLMLYITSMYTVFVSWPRYSVPFRPFFYLTAAWSIASIWRTIRSRQGIKIKPVEDRKK